MPKRGSTCDVRGCKLHTWKYIRLSVRGRRYTNYADYDIRGCAWRSPGGCATRVERYCGPGHHSTFYFRYAYPVRVGDYDRAARSHLDGGYRHIGSFWCTGDGWFPGHDYGWAPHGQKG